MEGNTYAAEMQALLDQAASLKASARTSYARQQNLPAGSPARDTQGQITNSLWNKMGVVFDRLRREGILDGFSCRTLKAINLGLTWRG